MLKDNVLYTRGFWIEVKGERKKKKRQATAGTRQKRLSLYPPSQLAASGIKLSWRQAKTQVREQNNKKYIYIYVVYICIYKDMYIVQLFTLKLDHC
jgi:hypothetical protein